MVIIIAMLDDDATSCRIASVSTSRTGHSTKPSCPVTRSVLPPYSHRTRFVIANRHLAGDDVRSADDEEGAG